jgi:ATP-dependent DNA helicase HFM1/MER3
LCSVDECHSVGTDVRGATLEVVVSRVKHFGARRTRFIAVSATVPNIDDIAEWFGSGINEEPAIVRQFGESFRPCRLQKSVFIMNSRTTG